MKLHLFFLAALLSIGINANSQSNPITMDSIISPSSLNYYQFDTVIVKVSNQSNDTISYYIIGYRINSGQFSYEIQTPNTPIQPNSSAIDTFVHMAYFQDTISNLCVYSLDSSNFSVIDSLCKTITLNLQQPALDAKVSSIQFQIDTSSQTILPEVYIKNSGTDTLFNIPVEYRIPSTNSIVNETWIGTLSSGDSTFFAFNSYFTPPPNNFTFCTRTKLLNDEDTLNDIKCINIDSSLVGIENTTSGNFILNQNIPNPATDEFSINYKLEKAGLINFELINNLGQIVYSENGLRKRGIHSVLLNASNLPSGIYFYILEFEGEKKIMKMIVKRN